MLLVNVFDCVLDFVLTVPPVTIATRFSTCEPMVHALALIQ